MPNNWRSKEKVIMRFLVSQSGPRPFRILNVLLTLAATQLYFRILILFIFV